MVGVAYYHKKKRLEIKLKKKEKRKKKEKKEANLYWKTKALGMLRKGARRFEGQICITNQKWCKDLSHLVIQGRNVKISHCSMKAT